MGLDTCRGSSGGHLTPGQLDAVEAVLTADPLAPTVVFGHYPITAQSGSSSLSGAQFITDRDSAARLEQIYSRTPGVFLHHSGHTHRNLLTRAEMAPHVSFLEVGATKEYTCGYSLLRIYEGGFTATFQRPDTAAAREWMAASSRQMAGLHPSYTLGGLGDRALSITRQLRAE